MEIEEKGSPEKQKLDQAQKASEEPHAPSLVNSNTGEDSNVSDERFKLLVTSVKDYAIFMLDQNGYVTTWNEGAKKFKGYDAHEIIGQHFSKFYTPEDIQAGKVEYEIKTAIEKGRVEDEGWRVRKDGTHFWANVVITRVNDSSGNLVGFAKVTRDLTERKQMEDVLKGSRDLLEKRVQERTQELEEAVKARDEFISVASHELKTPLTSLKLQAQITKRNLLKGHQQMLTAESLTQFADQLDKQVDKLRQLVEDMLDVSRIQRGALALRPEDTDLACLLYDLTDRLSADFERAGSPITLNIQQNVMGHWDRYRIEQVFVNLLSNAMKYGLGKPITLSMTADSERAIIKIIDQGIGIKKEDQERIFNRFERAISASEVSGLGLGLFITNEILKSHQGTVQVDSELGKGSEFTVTLPLKPRIAAQKKAIKDYEF